jgi:molybdenum cofactor cytidylyltransferase
MSVAIILLAAGRSSRMGASGQHKLLAEFDGCPLVRRSAVTALRSDAASVIVVTGHRKADIDHALEQLSLIRVHNPDFLSGMSSSLIVGLSTVEAQVADGVLIMLADMPAITTADLNMLIETFHEHGSATVVRSVSRGVRGNPAILPRETYSALLLLTGDIGARSVIEKCRLPVIDVEIGDGAHLDVDTPDAVIAAGGILRG